MKIKIIKASNKQLWYSDITFPVEFDVIKDLTHVYEVKTNRDGRIDYIFKDDCEIVNHTITIEDKRVFDTGAIRDSNKGKIRPDLISPYMLKALGRVLAEGAEHYTPRNWEKGMSDDVLKESASRHYLSWMNNETDEDHAAKLIFNVMAFIHFRDIK